MTRMFNDAATWMRLPAGIAVAGGAATVAAALAHVAIIDITGGVAAIAAALRRCRGRRKTQPDPRRSSAGKCPISGRKS